MRDQLPLVVGRPSREDFSIAECRGKGRGFPCVERLGRLDVVMTVEEDREPLRRNHPPAEDDRLSTSIHLRELAPPCGLLLLCLSPTALSANWLSEWVESVETEDHLFIPELSGNPVSLLNGVARTRTGGLDNLFKAALMPSRIPDLFTGKSFVLISENHTSFSCPTNRTAIPIRAPPLPYGTRS
jgi:hypothetical protein